MSLFGRLRWIALRARHSRRWERASAYLDGMLDEDEAAAFAQGRETDAAAREHFEDIQFIARGLASLPQPEPPRSFELTAEDITAAEPPAAIRQPAPKSLRLATAGAAASIAALAAVIAYDVLDNREEAVFYLESAPVLQTEREAPQAATAMLADFDQSEQSEQAEAALEEPPAAAATEEAASADEAAADEPESASSEAEAITWRSREEAQAAAEQEAAAAPAAQARFAAQRTESSAGQDEALDEPIAQPALLAAEDQAEDAATLAPAVIEEEEEPAPVASSEPEAALEDAEDEGLLMERGTEPVLLAESVSTGDAGWERPAQIALAIIAALATAGALWIKARSPRRPQT